MITIDLEENDDCVLIENESEKTKEPLKGFHFKKRLVSHVQKHRALYDNKHKFFSNVDMKGVIWQEIAKKLKSNVNDCKDTWFELRYDYQRYARNLRNYFIDGHKENRKRPAMALESEMIFLWRFIGDRKTCETNYVEEVNSIEAVDIPDDNATVNLMEIDDDATLNLKEIQRDSLYRNLPVNDDATVNRKEIDDDLILVEEPVELIVIDEDDDNFKSAKQFKMTATMKTLILEVKAYPELYDTSHWQFKDYTRKSYIWNAIASSLGDKATKLMKCWIVMQTRYEWEIFQTKDNAEVSELQVHLEFFKSFIILNPDTVYKQSFYLKTAWHEPIDYFKDIYNLIVRMKKMSDIVYITDSLLKTPEKSKQYISLWREIASTKNSSAGQCETTWLIMRYFYWELMHMRLQNYQLTDKWYFETIISELYAISKSAQISKQKELESLKQNRSIKKPNKRSAEPKSTLQGEPPNKRSSPIPVSTPTTTSTATRTQITPTITNNLQTAPTTNSTHQNTVVPPLLTLPKITAAISLAPQPLKTGPLQIKQISGPPALSPAPQPFLMTNSTHTAAPPSTTPAANTQMSMSFNLPSQTKVTPIPMSSIPMSSIPMSSIPMSSIIRPLPPTNLQPIRNTTQATISVRPRNVKPINIQQQATWSANTTANIKSILNSPIPTSVQNISTFDSGNYTPSTVAPTSPSSIAAFKITVPSNIAATNSTTPALHNNNNSTINMTTTPIVTNADNSPLPKISGAISLLNPNEILIELISSHNGNQLVVHGPALPTKYQLSMTMVAKFIREVLAIPLLHNKRIQPALINCYWEHIGNQFNLPVHICRACWNFLLENFNHFPQIAPLKELMKPFETSLNVWKESSVLFTKFHEECVAKYWLEYEKIIPDVIVAISGYPVLYSDVGTQDRSEKISQMETLCAWRTISLRFPRIRGIQDIWTAFKKCFMQYLDDLEIGIQNEWPMKWWRSFARMKFLIDARYSQNDPFYYITNNKMSEEIDKCATAEMKKRYDQDNVPQLNVVESIDVDKDDEEKKTNDIIKSVMDVYDKCSVEVELSALVSALQNHPIVFAKADNIEKYAAWKKIAAELRMDVMECLIAFKRVTEKYFAYKKQDNLSRFRINQRYYKKFDEIVRNVQNAKSSSSRGKINIKTPFELNQSFETDTSPQVSELIFPERYLSDISMWNCPTSLVVKNWVFAIGNINVIQTYFNFLLKNILQKYIPHLE